MNDRTRFDEPPHLDHATIRDAAACPECRAWIIGNLEDAPYAYLLMFPPADGDPHAVSLVRDWAPGSANAAETAWATGCNRPRRLYVAEIPVGVAIESGVEMFTLLEGDDAAHALQAIRGLHAIDEPQWDMACSCCGETPAG
jgi:hypothetical protein